MFLDKNDIEDIRNLFKEKRNENAQYHAIESKKIKLGISTCGLTEDELYSKISHENTHLEYLEHGFSHILDYAKKYLDRCIWDCYNKLRYIENEETCVKIRMEIERLKKEMEELQW